MVEGYAEHVAFAIISSGWIRERCTVYYNPRGLVIGGHFHFYGCDLFQSDKNTL
jgi:hypothetical protein